MYQFVVDCECVIENKGRFLVIERPRGVHGGGLLAFPGGKMESADGAMDQDALKAAARRELREEVGLTYNGPLQYVTSSVFPDSKTAKFCVAVIFHGVLDGEAPILSVADREVVQTHWLTKEQLVAHPLCPPWMRRYAEAITQL